MQPPRMHNRNDIISGILETMTKIGGLHKCQRVLHMYLRIILLVPKKRR